MEPGVESRIESSFQLLGHNDELDPFVGRMRFLRKKAKLNGVIYIVTRCFCSAIDKFLSFFFSYRPIQSIHFSEQIPILRRIKAGVIRKLIKPYSS